MKAHAVFPALALFLMPAGVAAGALLRPQRPIVASPGVLGVEGQMEAGRMVRWVRPVYPAAAMKARVQGMVVFDALIDVKGDVERLKYVSGPPVLVESAREAARRWEYTPVLFSGVAMNVETTIRVILTLPDKGKRKPEFVRRPRPPRRHRPAKHRSAARAEAATILRLVRPKYPFEAKHEGIEGSVVLKALISKDGRVIELRYVSGPMPLAKASMDVVRQWLYLPAPINGLPIEVPVTIRLIFCPGHKTRIRTGAARSGRFAASR